MSDDQARCRGCGAHACASLLDFGEQPLSNRFLTTATAPEPRFPLTLAICETCGLAQLAQTAPIDELRPRFDWIHYNEAEGHLDEAVEQLLKLSPPSGKKSVLGITYKDQSTVDRLQQAGMGQTAVIEPDKDLGISDPLAGTETIQHALTPDTAARVINTQAPADIVVARHILEHAFNPTPFLDAISTLMKPDALVFFEVPDTTIVFDSGVYSAVWEEHISYFTPFTLRSLLAQSGFVIEALLIYPYSLENSLVCIARKGEVGETSTSDDIERELIRARAFAQGFSSTKKRTQETLDASTGPIAVFGAGHHACKYINFMDIADRIQFVADDHPQKKGLFMPGSHVPIMGSERLVGDRIELCLLTLNPESENKVLAKCPAFQNTGIKTASIFPASPRSLL